MKLLYNNHLVAILLILPFLLTCCNSDISKKNNSKNIVYCEVWRSIVDKKNQDEIVLLIDTAREIYYWWNESDSQYMNYPMIGRCEVAGDVVKLSFPGRILKFSRTGEELRTADSEIDYFHSGFVMRKKKSFKFMESELKLNFPPPAIDNYLTRE